MNKQIASDSEMSSNNIDTNNNLPDIQTAVGRGKLLQEAKRFISMKSPDKEMSKPEVMECICHRRIMGILCRSCGNVFRGRVQQRCRLHPNSKYLMDHVICPSCKATQLREFEELSDMDCEKERNF